MSRKLTKFTPEFRDEAAKLVVEKSRTIAEVAREQNTGWEKRRSVTGLRENLAIWINDERPGWPGATTEPALLLNRRGGRLTVKGADDILGRIAETAGIDDFTTHVLRHSFGTNLVRDGTDLVLVAELMGHGRLESTRRYTRPSAADREKAVNNLPTDR